VERRDTGRDGWLTARMILVCAALALAYAACVTASVLLVVLFWDTSPLLAFVPALVAMLLLVHFTLADMLVLSSARARRTSRREEPELHDVVERLSLLAGVRPPGVAVSSLPVANALAAGLTPARATIVVTDALRDGLTESELEAVFAHELSHVANRDALVMTGASFFRTLAGVLDLRRLLSSTGGDAPSEPFQLEDLGVWIGFWLLSPIRWVLLGFGTVLTLAPSRYREYAADRGAANLTGTPEQLMSALQKLDGGGRQIPQADLRRAANAEAFFIVPVRARSLELLSDHPPLEKRLARLAEIARELGEPVAV
jgi:heat shock protein HtpX